MATRVLNNSDGNLTLPFTYGDAILRPGTAVIIADTVANVSAVLSSLIGGVRLSLVPDGQPGAITPGGSSGQSTVGTQQISSAATVTVTSQNSYVGLQATTGQTANLPSGATCIVGQELTIDDLGGNSATNAHTITANGSDTIDGSASLTLNQNNGTIRLRLISATTWRVVA